MSATYDTSDVCSDSQGGGRLIGMRFSLNITGGPTSFILPERGCYRKSWQLWMAKKWNQTSISVTIPRETACGCWNVCSILLIGPKGMLLGRSETLASQTYRNTNPRPENFSSQYPRFWVIKASVMICISSCLLATRAALEENLGFDARSGCLRIWSVNNLNYFHSQRTIEAARLANLFVISSSNHDKPVFAGKYLIWRNRRMSCSMSWCFFSCYKIVRSNIGQTGKLLGHSHVKVDIVEAKIVPPVFRKDYNLCERLFRFSDEITGQPLLHHAYTDQ